MSQLGHSLQKRDVRAMSVLPLIATEERTSRDVSNVPIGDVALMLDEKEATNRGGLTLSASELDVAVSLIG
jgi:hypothetical protein